MSLLHLQQHKEKQTNSDTNKLTQTHIIQTTKQHDNFRDCKATTSTAYRTWNRIKTNQCWDELFSIPISIGIKFSTHINKNHKTTLSKQKERRTKTYTGWIPLTMGLIQPEEKHRKTYTVPTPTQLPQNHRSDNKVQCFNSPFQYRVQRFNSVAMTLTTYFQ